LSPHSLEFYCEHDGRSFDGDTSTDVAKLCDMEMRNISANRRKQSPQQWPSYISAELDDQIQKGMSKISIGPPVLPLERDLESH